MSETPIVGQQEFHEFLHGVALQSIAVESCIATIRDPGLRSADRKQLRLAFTYESKLALNEPNGFEALAFYGARILPTPDANSDDSWLAQMEIEYRVRYESSTQIRDDLFTIFQQVTLRLNTVPFAREWMHQTSLKMGIPPVLIPLAVSVPRSVSNSEKAPRGKNATT